MVASEVVLFVLFYSQQIIAGDLLPRNLIIKDDSADLDDILRPLDFYAARDFDSILRSLGLTTKISTVDPTLGRKYEGDIDWSRGKRLIFMPQTYRIQTWPGGVVPYVLSDAYLPLARSLIARVFDDIEQVTCVKFVPRTNQRNYIRIFPHDRECYSSAGMIGGMQKLSLGPDCLQYGTIMHELNHALGRWHEQSRPDRDRYVNILWSNIVRENANQFSKHPKESSDENELSLPYDYSSILHYSPYAFSRNGLPTIEALKPGGNKMGQRDGMSPLDIEKLNRMYNCPEKKRPEEEVDEGEPDVLELYNFSTRGPTTVENTPENRKCDDYTSQCSFYIALGGCQSATVLKYCPKSCGACRPLFKIATTTTTPAAGSIIEKKSKECRDRTPFSCSLWSSNGDCRTKTKFMARYCPKTCRICRDDQEDTVAKKNSSYCNDEYESTCKYLARSGLCGSFEFLSRKCPKSCGRCDNLNRKNETTRRLFQEKCEDRNEMCRIWSSMGYCTNRKFEFVKRRCPFSCMVCRS